MGALTTHDPLAHLGAIPNCPPATALLASPTGTTMGQAMDVATLIARARSGLGKKTQYSSPGVTPPLAANTWPAAGDKSDCSGFLAWCLRISRKIDHPKYVAVNGGWFETTAIQADVGGPWGYFEEMQVPAVGAFVVYPDKDGHDGHIGVISAVNGSKGVSGIVKVIHCSNGGWKNHGDAIRETDAAPWAARSDTRIGWYSGIV